MPVILIFLLAGIGVWNAPGVPVAGASAQPVVLYNSETHDAQQCTAADYGTFNADYRRAIDTCVDGWRKQGYELLSK